MNIINGKRRAHAHELLLQDRNLVVATIYKFRKTCIAAFFVQNININNKGVKKASHTCTVLSNVLSVLAIIIIIAINKGQPEMS